MEVVVVPQPETGSTMLGDPDAQTCCRAGLLLRQNAAFPRAASPIYSHASRWAAVPIGHSIAETRLSGGKRVWKR